MKRKSGHEKIDWGVERGKMQQQKKLERARRMWQKAWPMGAQGRRGGAHSKKAANSSQGTAENQTMGKFKHTVRVWRSTLTFRE